MSSPGTNGTDLVDQVRPRQHVASVSRAAATYKRKKATTACEICRARRTKCDNGRPCSYCMKNGHECVSSDQQTPRWDPATMHILERIDGLESQLAGVSQSISTVKRHDIDATSPASVQTGISLSRLTPQSLHPQSLEAVLRWTPLQQLGESGEVARGSPELHRPKTWSKSCSPDLEYSTCRRRIDAFFAYVHPKNPILSEQEVRAAVKKACFDGFRWTTDHAVLLLLLSIGALAMPFVDERHHTCQPDLESAQSLYHASQKRFQSEPRHSYLVQAKHLFYSGVYLMSMLQPFDAWRAFLQALAVCQGFSALALSHPGSTGEKRDEESLYWSCWKSEREVRSELDLPDFSTTASDHPQMYPSLPHDSDVETLKSWYFYLAEISLWRLETSARKDIAEFAIRERDADLEKLAVIVGQLQEPLKSWQSSLPPDLSLEETSDRDSEILRFVLQGRLTYNHELLTWPFLHAAIHVCGQLEPKAQQLAIEALYRHYERLTINRPGFFHRHHGTWLMMRSSARSACIILAAALTPTLSAYLPPGWTDLIWNTIDMLDYWNQRDGGMDNVAMFLRHEMSKFG